MKYLIFIYICSFIFVQSVFSQGTQCGTLSSGIDARHLKLMGDFSNPQLSLSGKTSSTLNIPVVFHIVYGNAAENINDSLIYQQLQILNDDFQRNNADTLNTPQAFRSLTGRMDIEFCLATQMPDGTPTNGILRIPTGVTAFASPVSYSVPDPIKRTSMGGSDSWDVTKYVNIWICNLLGSTAYTAPVGNFLPGDDGLVCHYNHIGNSHIYPYGSGRSIVHEMGHYFCLKHIWGDDGGLCSGTDYISDTPNQSNYSTNCPTFPGTDSCSPLSPGVMYMNFMDYSADECRNMFTAGQVAYMQSCISAILPALPNSTACSPVTSRAKTKREYSFGLFPNPGNGEFTIETDFLEYEISVRDMAGIQLFRKKINSSTFIWKEKLPPGIYFVSLSWETGKITRKIIVL